MKQRGKGTSLAVALETVDRRFARPSVITNGRPIAIASKFLPRRTVVRFMGFTQRRAMNLA